MPSEKKRRPGRETGDDEKTRAECVSIKYPKPVNALLVFALLSDWDMERAVERYRDYAESARRRHAAARREHVHHELPIPLSVAESRLWRREANRDQIRWMIRLRPGEVSRGGGRQWQHADGKWHNRPPEAELVGLVAA